MPMQWHKLKIVGKCEHTRKQFFGENRRYAVAPIHTRFDALEWFVWDAEHPLSDLNHAEVIRQAETLEEALRGL